MRSTCVSVIVALLATAWWAVAPATAIEVVSETVVATPPPGSGWSAWAYSFYIRGQGSDKMYLGFNQPPGTEDALQWRSRTSTDNGANWTDWAPYSAGAARGPYPGWVDPNNGWLLQMVSWDSPTTCYALGYRVSDNGGQTFAVDRQVIQTGSQYDASHPADGVWAGKNAMIIGANSCVPIHTRGENGKVLVPVNIQLLNADGSRYLPGGAGDYYDSAVLIGSWHGDKTLSWELSQPVQANPTLTTRGLCEPTVAQMPDGRILMVMRGSNEGNVSLPGRKWYSVSNDGGMNWSTPEPWTYSDGSDFYSPSSCSQLLQHSSGKYYWIGNICDHNPNGNDPRYPLVIGQVDPDSLMLIEDTVTLIDTLGGEPGDNSSLQLSNFRAHEDRVTHEIILDVPRYLGGAGDAYCYRIAVHAPEPSCLAILISATAALVTICYARHGISPWRERSP
jgi:hypothetical protein